MEERVKKNSDDIDIEQIMRDIREDIQVKGYESDILSFEEMLTTDHQLPVELFDKIQFNEALMTVNQIWQMPYVFPLPESKGALRKPMMFFKRVVRRLIRFHTDPMIMEQSQRNALFVQLLNHTNAYIGEQMHGARDNTLERLNFYVKRDMTKRVNQCMAENARLLEENAQLNARLEALEGADMERKLWDQRIKLLEIKIEQQQTAPSR